MPIIPLSILYIFCIIVQHACESSRSTIRGMMSSLIDNIKILSLYCFLLKVVSVEMGA